MMLRIKILYITLVLFFIAASVQAAYIKSWRTIIHEKPDYNSKPVITVQRGQKVEEIETSGKWVKVNINSLTGWIMRMKLSDKPALRKTSFRSTSTQTQPPKRKQLRLRVARAVVGVKGLRDSQAQRIKEDKSDFKALEQMETFVVAEETAMKYIMDYKE